MKLVVCSPSFPRQLLLPILVIFYRPLPVFRAFDILSPFLGFCLRPQHLCQFLLSFKPCGIPSCDFGLCRLLDE